MKQLTLFLVIIVLANYSFALPVTKVEEKKEEKSESVEETSEDVEVNYQHSFQQLFTFSGFLFYES